jgi:pimeloyl-ACP methyl ester carboxylesterase
MALMRHRIARCGYRTASYSYPSIRLTLAENADRFAQYCRGFAASRLHFVGHSLGGLVILRMLECAPDLRVGRVVLAGTPFGDSFSAQRLARLPGGRAALGRSMPEWLRERKPERLSAHEIGVIAGSLPVGLGRLLAPGLPTPNDGVVTVAETRLPEMRDHIVLRINHTGMLLSSTVARQICAFLRSGAFVHA